MDENQLSVEHLAKFNQNEMKLMEFMLLPRQSLTFALFFSPKSPQIYRFNFPLTLFNYGTLPGAECTICCKGLLPKYQIIPQTVEFQRKLIQPSNLGFPIN